MPRLGGSPPSAGRPRTAPADRARSAPTTAPSSWSGGCATRLRLNADLPPEALGDAFRKLTRPEGSTLKARNRAFHRTLVEERIGDLDAELVVAGIAIALDYRP